MRGVVTATGIAVEHNGRRVELPPTPTPLGVAVRELCTAILAGDVEPCPVCGRYDCDRDEWHELMHGGPDFDPDPHGDLSVWADEEIPY
jgi:hypothetical protein